MRRFGTRSGGRALGALAAAALLAVGLPAANVSAVTNVTVTVLSTRADLVSADDALVAIGLPPGTNPAAVTVTLNGVGITGRFAVRPNGRFEGLVTGLALGANSLEARLSNGTGARLTILNHPNGGPIFAGPQVLPWVCQAGATDAQCNAPTTFAFKYVEKGTGQLKDYDPSKPPAAVAKTTTDQGVKVPFIIRLETGYQDRDQYQIAILYDPTKAWAPWAPQPQWNHKLLITHGASCGIDHQAGAAPSTTGDTLGAPGVGGSSSPLLALGRGFAVMSTALNNAGHNCALITQAESMIMAKEHLVESYGEIRYTIGTGCSGGSLVQQQVANAYPGLYQGILPQCSFPDAWSTGQQLADYHLVRLYVEHPDRWGKKVAWSPADIAAVEGHPNHVNSIILDQLYFTATGDPTSNCAGVTAQQRYSSTNPGGVRCTLADVMVNVFGRRPQDGFAGRPLDNVGIQYGLLALMRGQITPAQFADLNAKVGGADIDAKFQADRIAADEPALLNSYRSGSVNETTNLDQVAIIDLRGTDPGAFHDVYRAFAIRARLERAHGTYANQVIWEGTVPLLGDANYTRLGLLAMDRWLTAVEADHRAVPLPQKVIEDKPADIHDQCTDGVGQVIPSDDVCKAINPMFTTPRVVAGEGIATDNQKCRLKPLLRSDYFPIEFTEKQWAQVQSAFPTGVCDWSLPGVDQSPTIPWMTYDVVGGRPLGDPPVSVPF